MATDVEESDTDDHEKPVSPKRQCTRLVTVNETSWDMEKSSSEKEEMIQDAENVEYDDAERHAREKVKRWQICQMAKGLLDNTINRFIENYNVGRPSPEPVEEHSLQLFIRNEMEDTAIAMAIRNHGLVQSTGLVTQSNAFYSDRAPGYWSNNEYADLDHCSCPSNPVQDVGNVENTLATTSTNSLRLNNSTEMGGYNGLDWDLDKMDESDQLSVFQENFLETAVAVAIKKKGLSALSVDHG